MTIMDRSISYQINSLEKPQKISGFLKEKGYSRQNLVDLRKNEQAICLNGTYVHMNHMLAEGDVLTVSDFTLPLQGIALAGLQNESSTLWYAARRLNEGMDADAAAALNDALWEKLG